MLDIGYCLLLDIEHNYVPTKYNSKNQKCEQWDVLAGGETGYRGGRFGVLHVAARSMRSRCVMRSENKK